MPETFAYPKKLVRRKIHSLGSLPDILRETANWLEENKIDEDTVYSMEVHLSWEGTGHYIVINIGEDYQKE